MAKKSRVDKSLAKIMAEATPLQRARMRAAAEALYSGGESIDLCCGFCQSTSIFNEQLDYPPALTCAACGRKTLVEAAHTVRKQSIRAFIMTGIDVQVGKVKL